MGARVTANQPSLVIFDLDHTLYDFDIAHAAGMSALRAFAGAQLGARGSAFEEAFAEARQNVKARLGSTASSHSRLLYCHEALEILGIRSEPVMALQMEQEYWRNYLSAAVLRPGVSGMLQTLRYNNVVTAVVTDLTAQIQFRKIVHLDLTREIDHIVCSEETKGEKESLEPFRLLFERVHAGAREHVWFVGDRDFDAPVQELIDLGLIDSGRGFVLAAQATGHVTGWHDFLELERMTDSIFGNG